MPYSSIFKRGSKRGENEQPAPQGTYSYQPYNYQPQQTAAPVYQTTQSAPPLYRPPPPLPPRESLQSPVFAPPPSSTVVSRNPQQMERYNAPPQQALSPPRPTSLSPPIATPQRSPSPQSYPALQSSLSLPAAIPQQRSPSPNHYPVLQAPGPPPLQSQPMPRTAASPRPTVKRDPPKVRKILSLDGGGVRGLSIIKIMKYIMQELNRERGLEETPLHPWQEFDMIGGTSTGGLANPHQSHNL